MTDGRPTNDEVADVLEEIADLLEIGEANRFRIRAYRDAANTVRSLDEPIEELALEEGAGELETIPGIGEGIARVITSYARTGRSELLERLRGEMVPAALFEQVPGIGEELARRIAEELDISTLEELEQAAHDSRLQEVRGFGPERVRNVQISLAGWLSTAAQRRRRRARDGDGPGQEPQVETLLAVDQLYRRKAAAGELRRIAPKRFNPEGEAWLPISNVERDGWRFTALYSNTRRAHELDKTDDWVVLYYERDGEEGQATVVTETRGPLEGRRVVRGREDECADHHRREGKG